MAPERSRRLGPALPDRHHWPMRLSVSLPTTNTLAFPTAGSFAVAKPIPEELIFRSRCIVDIDDAQALLWQLVENSQRVDVQP